jgi:hypothetical protein
MHQFDFLEIQEETVIEEAHVSDRRASQHYASTGHPIDIAALVGLNDGRADTKEAAQELRSRTAHKLATRRRKAKRRCRFGAVQCEQSASCRATGRLFSQFGY